MSPRVSNLLVVLAAFFLPWQTLLILGGETIAGETSVYGVCGVYAVEVILIVAFFLRGRPQVSQTIRPIVKAFFLFLAAAFFSLAFSKWDTVGWFHLVHVVCAGLFFLLLIDERTHVKQVVIAFLAGLVVPIVIGWEQVLTGSSFASTVFGIAEKRSQIAGTAVVETLDGRTLRAYGTLPHPNIFGGFLAVGIVMFAWITQFVTTRQRLVLAIASSAVLSASIIITFSRSAWLALVVAFITLVTLALYQGRVLSRRVIPIMALGLVCLLAALIFFHTQVFARFNPSLRVEAISIEERASQYQTFVPVFSSAPMLGVGPGAYTFALASQNPGQPAWDYQPIHNTLLLILLELGVVGFVFFAHWIYRIDKLAHTLWREPNGIYALALGTTLLIIALLDHYLWSLWPGLVLCALALAVIVKWSYNDRGKLS
jgi:O-antigen ligase